MTMHECICFSRTFFFRQTISPMMVNSSLINKDFFILFFLRYFLLFYDEFLKFWFSSTRSKLDFRIWKSFIDSTTFFDSFVSFLFENLISPIETILWIISILVKLFSIRFPFEFHGDWHNCWVVEQRRDSIKSSCNPIKNSSNFPLMIYIVLSLVLSAYLNIHELF